MPARWFKAATVDGGLAAVVLGQPTLSSTSVRLAEVTRAATTTPGQLAASWRSASPCTSVQVGTTSEAPFVLDLARNGPHGLVGGMSRSGKTEFLKTFICALSWANHPDDLNFVIVDFKGGVDYTMAAGLPHVLDVGSNADLGRFERTIGMLSSEMERRQASVKPLDVANLEAYRLAQVGRPDLPKIRGSSCSSTSSSS